MDGTVTPIAIATNTAGTPITVETIFPAIFGIAISPDGQTGYVDDATFGSIVTFDVATATETSPSVVLPEGGRAWLTVKPNGNEIFAATDPGVDSPNSGQLSALILPTFDGSAGDRLGLGKDPTSLAITPDGAHVYTANNGSGTLSEYSFDAESIATISLGGSPHGLAASPDGKIVWVADGSDGKLVRVVVASGSHAVSVQVGTTIDALAIAPDQAPVARFTVSPAVHGQPTSFDASSSTVRFGAIARYVWHFGDGKTATTKTPTTTHTYAAARNYTATVTETDSAGTNTAIIYTGQTVSRNGAPSAVSSRTFTVS